VRNDGKYMRRYARHMSRARALTVIEVPSVVRIGLGVGDWPRTSPAKLILWETMGARAREIVSGWIMRSRLGDEDVGIRRLGLWHLSSRHMWEYNGSAVSR
jgi:hypothetical protein